MKKLIVSIIATLCLLCMVSCTTQQRAKKFGGKSVMFLPAGKKLVIATWKDSNLWLLTRDCRENEVPETYNFSESSSWGIFQGTIIIQEK